MKTDLTRYALAREYVADGRWIVDPDIGVVTSRLTGKSMGYRGQNGYIALAIQRGGKIVQILAHRVIWEYANEAITGPTLDINHLNGVKHDNRIVNLELATRQRNNHHAVISGLTPPQRRGEQSPLSSLKDEDVLHIVARLKAGEPQATIAADFGVSQTTISFIKRGKRYTNVTGGPLGLPTRPETTHCPRGHPFNGANTYLSQGYKLCRVCRRKGGRAKPAGDILDLAIEQQRGEAS